MTQEIIVLMVTAVTIGFLHTVLGPDHYIPFIAISRARRWSLTKTALVTLACGGGHVLSSIGLGFVGIALGLAVGRLEALEAFRGGVAGWLLIGFGVAYTIWGVRRSIKAKPHQHFHVHKDGEGHDHEHNHAGGHSHVHLDEEKKRVTPWVLFVIFFFGPCEPLIPLLMYPAAKASLSGTILVAGTFGLVTMATMLAMVMLTVTGVRFVKLGGLERYTHALAGAAIVASGLGVQFLGL